MLCFQTEYCQRHLYTHHRFRRKIQKNTWQQKTSLCMTTSGTKEGQIGPRTATQTDRQPLFLGRCEMENEAGVFPTRSPAEYPCPCVHTITKERFVRCGSPFCMCQAGFGKKIRELWGVLGKSGSLSAKSQHPS